MPRLYIHDPRGVEPDNYQKTQEYLQKRFGVENGERLYNPGTTRVPMFGWVIHVGEKTTKVVGGPEPCRMGIKEIPIDIQALADEKGGEEKGFIAIVSIHNKKRDLEKELKIGKEEKKKHGLLDLLKWRK